MSPAQMCCYRANQMFREDDSTTRYGHHVSKDQVLGASPKRTIFVLSADSKVPRMCLLGTWVNTSGGALGRSSSALAQLLGACYLSFLRKRQPRVNGQF